MGEQWGNDFDVVEIDWCMSVYACAQDDDDVDNDNDDDGDDDDNLLASLRYRN